MKTLNEKNVLAEKVNQNQTDCHNLNETLKENQTYLDHLEVQMEVSEEKIKELKQEKHKLQKRLCGLKINRQKSKCRLVEKHETQILELKNKIEMNNKKIAELEQLNVCLENDKILTFENGRYINEVRECIMSLVTECNVSIKKVNKVISTVLRNLTG